MALRNALIAFLDPGQGQSGLNDLFCSYFEK